MKTDPSIYKDMLGTPFKPQTNCTWVARRVLSRMGYKVHPDVLPKRETGVFKAQEHAEADPGLLELPKSFKAADVQGSIVLTFDDLRKTHHVYVGLGGGEFLSTITPSGCRVFSLAACQRIGGEIVGCYKVVVRKEPTPRRKKRRRSA